MKTDPDLVAVRGLGTEPSAESVTRTRYSLNKKQALRGRRSRSRILIPVAAAALAAVLAGGGSLLYNAGSGVLWPVASSPDAVATLHSLADSAALGAPVSIGAGQVIRTDSRGAGGACGPNECRIEPQNRQRWYDPHAGAMVKLMDGDTDMLAGHRAEPADAPPVEPGIRRPTLTWLSSLPFDDPEQLLKRLRVEMGHHERWTVDHQLWDAMGEVYHNFEIALTPEQRSALLRAFTGMTGLTVRDLTIDGRPVVAIRHTERDNANEVLFDLGTGRAMGRASAYLGDDMTIVQMPDGPALAPNVLYQATYSQSIVDSPGQ